MALDHPLQGPRTEHRIIPLVRQPRQGIGIQLERDLARRQPLFQPPELNGDNAIHIGAVQAVKDDLLIQTVQELGAEMLAHRLFHLTPRTCRVRPFGQFRQGPRAKVRGEDDQRLLKVHRAPLTVGQDAIIQDLQQHVEHIRMGFLNLIKQNHLIGPPPHRFGQHAPLIIADIARRRTDQPRDRVFLHEFRHVDADHRVFIVEKIGGNGFGQLGLADTGRAKEEEAAQRPPLIVQPSARTADSV